MRRGDVKRTKVMTSYRVNEMDTGDVSVALWECKLALGASSRQQVANYGTYLHRLLMLRRSLSWEMNPLDGSRITSVLNIEVCFIGMNRWLVQFPRWPLITSAVASNFRNMLAKFKLTSLTVDHVGVARNS